MGILKKADILGVSDLKTEDVTVPEWGGDVRLRTMTGAERDAFESSFTDQEGKRDMTNLRARLLAQVIVDENGERVFEADDAILLGNKSSAVLNRLFDVAQRLNGIGDKAEAELEKN